MDELAQDILDSVQVGALATVNRDSTPLVTPLHFARMGNEVVWLSDRTSRHSMNVLRTGRAEFVVWDPQKRAVFITATVRELVDETELQAAQKVYADKLGGFVPQLENVQWYAAKIGAIDEKTTTENWLHYVA